MQGPRTPEAHELNKVVDFLNQNLRINNPWPIASEYPTALSSSNIHNMSIITEDEKVVSHAVLKTLIIKTPLIIYKIGAIGSVVTSPEYRNQGLSRRNIENCIDLAKKQDCDFVILWTDQFDFYRKFGFELAGFDYSYVIENENPIENKDIKFLNTNQVDPEALLRIYNQHTVHAIRTSEDFRQFLKIPQTHLYTAWNSQNQLMAYAAEGKGVDLVNYIHEWGGKTEVLLDLFNYVFQQKKSPITVMTPKHSINLHEKLKHVCSFYHHGYLGMVKTIQTEQFLTKIKKAFRSEGFENIVLEKQNENIVFGFGQDLYTLNHEKDLIQLLFGPLEIEQLDFVSKEVKQKLSQILPLPLWIWGWDSI